MPGHDRKDASRQQVVQVGGFAPQVEFSKAVHSEKLVDFAMAEVDQRERPSGRARELGFEVQAEAVEDRCGDVGRLDGPVRGHGADRVAGPDDPASLDAAAGEPHGVAERPVVAPAGRVHPRRAAELGQVADQRRIEHAPLREVFDRAV